MWTYVIHISQMALNNVMNSYDFSSSFLSWQTESFKSSTNKTTPQHILETGWCQEAEFLRQIVF